MLWKLPEALEEVLEEIGMLPIEYMELEKELSDKDLEILDVIVRTHTKAEYRLYIKEMCKKLEKKGKLDTKYKKFVV